MTQDKNSPAYEGQTYQASLAPLAIVRDVTGGTLALRAKGTAYLPQESAELKAEYEIKRARALLFGVTKRTLQALVGMVFRKDPKLADDVPVRIAGVEVSDESAEVEGLWENIDNAGTHGSVFAQTLFEAAMRDGHAFVLVDMPPAVIAEGATLADEQGRRPYWTMRKKDQAISWRTEVIDGRLRLAQIVFKEITCEADGDYGEADVTRHRVLRPGSFAIYREITGDGGKKTIILETEGVTSLSEIPVAVVYGDKCGVLESTPPLLDLALINLTHYQKYADYSIYLHLCRPILWFRGRDKNVTIQPIGPYTIFDVSEQNGTVEFAEPTGAALGAARTDLQDLEKWMSVYGLSLLVPKPTSQQTATGEILDKVAEESPLATAARSLKDCLELALGYTAQFLGEKSGGSVELGASLADLTIPPDKMRVLLEAAGKTLSMETVWSILQRGGELPEDFDAESEAKRLEAQATANAGALMDAFNRGDV